MTERKADNLETEYRTALQNYLEGGGEQSLKTAYELGRRAIARTSGIMEMALVHHRAMAEEIERVPMTQEGTALLQRGQKFFEECIGSFEMPIRGYREASEELRRINRDLERRVEERTAELREKERLLRKHADDLARSNEELQQFAYIASHDLQEPLRMITSYMQILEKKYKGALDESADKYIAYAVDGAKRMQQMIQALLQYSRVDRREIHKVRVDLKSTVRDALTNLESAVRESDARIDAQALPTVEADPDLLLQVIQNLVSNALKYHGGKPPEIRIRGKRDGGEWVISVEDNGIGMSQDQAKRIFRLFQRLEPAKTQGTGIGLTITKKIIERHGGRIWVESEPGKGTTFYFTLPAADHPATAS